MRPFFRLLWKELRELARAQYLVPMLLVPLLFVALGQGAAGISDEISDEPTVGLVTADDGALAAAADETIREEANVVYESGTVPEDPQRIAATVNEDGGDALLVVPPDFTERIRQGESARIEVYTAVDEVSLVGLAASSSVDAVVDAAERAVTLRATNATATTLSPIDPTYRTYVDGQSVDAAPGAISAAFSTQYVFVPIVVVFVLLFSGQMVIAAMGIEKENRTLETLLTMPISRRAIVVSKLAAGATLGLVATALYVGGIVAYQAGFAAVGTLPPAFQLGPAAYALIAVSLFLSLVGVLALALSLGAFVDDRQGAQVLMLPISSLAVVPMFVTMFTDFDALGPLAQAALFAIPLTHPVIAPKRLLLGDVWMVVAGIGYELLFLGAAIALTARLFTSDRLITGVGELDDLLGSLGR